MPKENIKLFPKHEYECLCCLTMKVCEFSKCQDDCVKVCGSCSRQIVKDVFSNGLESVLRKLKSV